MSRYQKREESDPAYCIELFRRALHGKQEEAWERLLDGCIADFVRAKLYRHVCWRLARKYQEEKFYVMESFTRLWRSNVGHPLRLESLGGLLSLLHQCLHSAILEELRFWTPPDARGKRSVPQPAQSEPMTGPDPTADDVLRRELLLEMKACARTDRERRIFALRWEQGYTPQAMVEIWPEVFPSTHEISQILQNILARFYRRQRKLDESES
jgi:hypothetical protein